jgi:replicative DNA helicase
MNIGSILLHRILSNPKEETSLEAWSKVRSKFFSTEYSSIFNAISKFYDDRAELPGFNDIQIINRETQLGSNFIALSKLETPEDVSLDVITDALIDQFMQEQCLQKLDSFIDNITFYDTEEIKQGLGDISLELDDEVYSDANTVRMSDIMIENEEEVEGDRVYLGLNNDFDAEVMARTQELILIGGKVGAGKTVVGVNAAVNQYTKNQTSLFFSIEMPAKQIFERILSILSGIDHSVIRRGIYTEEQYNTLANIRRNMFQDTDKAYNKFLENKDFKAFEIDLTRNNKLTENQMIIVDNQRLTLADIDIALHKTKARFGDRFKLCVVDYVNQIDVGEGTYGWIEQISISKALKNMARKHDVLILSPYQIDAKGGTRFSKGILDAADCAFTLEPNNNSIAFKSVKTRGTPPFEYNSSITWNTLKIDPVNIIIEENNDNDKTERKGKGESGEDLPW